MKASADIKIDTISTDAVVSSAGTSARRTRRSSASSAFLERRDELVALQILYRLPYAQRRLTYQALNDLREALRRPPWLLQPIDIWRAYKRLAADKVRGNPANTLADIVMLVRYAIGEAETLEPLPSIVAGQFDLWLAVRRRPDRASPTSRRAGSPAIHDHLAVNVERRWTTSWTRRSSARETGCCGRGHCSARDCRSCWRN